MRPSTTTETMMLSTPVATLYQGAGTSTGRKSRVSATIARIVDFGIHEVTRPLATDAPLQLDLSS